MLALPVQHFANKNNSHLILGMDQREQAHSYSKRIKTEATSMRTSPTASPNSGKNRFYREEHKFPSLYKNERRYQSYSLNMINEEQGTANSYWQETRDKRNMMSMPHHKRKEMEKAEKIYEALCKNAEIPAETFIVKTSNVRLESQNVQIYQKVRLTFEGMKKARKLKDVQQIFGLITALKTINNLFVKLDDILSLILLKKGKIQQFEQNSIIYNQNQPQTNLLIVLWGEIKLKEIYRRKIKFCIPGDMLCQQIVAEQKKGRRRYFSEIGFSKGNLIALETAKTQTKCGILEISKETYEQIKDRFSENGQKDKMLMFEHMLAWSLSKKAKLRK